MKISEALATYVLMHKLKPDLHVSLFVEDLQSLATGIYLINSMALFFAQKKAIILQNEQDTQVLQ